jgi:probable DNA metabolism protein
MAIWTYDGTFTGLLSTLAELFRRGEEPEDLIPQGDDPGMSEGACRHSSALDVGRAALRDLASTQGVLFGTERVPTDPDRAEAIASAVRRHLGDRAFEALLLAFLSERPRIETALWRFLEAGRRNGPEFLRRLEDPRVRSILLARRAVCAEAHRFLGILRFAQVGNVLYAPFEPGCDILELLAPHFARRLPEERWVLHDVRRRKALAHRDGRVVPLEAPGEPLPIREDRQFRDLWRLYFETARIDHRANLKLQKRFIPERYWKYLPEKAPALL